MIRKWCARMVMTTAKCLPRLTMLLCFTLCLLGLKGMYEVVQLGREWSREERIWTSMSICWGENFKGYGKKDFPYSVAAYYSALLWRNQTGHRVSVLLTIVTELARGEDSSLDYYIRRFEDIPGSVVVLQPDMVGSCVLQAQVGRMWAFNYSFVDSSDLVILGDSDLFLIGDSVMEMVSHPGKLWIGEYSHTVRTGGTINMNLVAMAAGDWALGLDFSTRQEGGPVGLPAVVAHFKGLNGPTGWGVWEVDQVILSNAILRPDRQLCSLAKENKLWKRLKLEPREINDTELCFHGNLMNCNRNQRRSHCPWWHFLPSDREATIKKVYSDIVTGVIASNETTRGRRKINL